MLERGIMLLVHLSTASSEQRGMVSRRSREVFRERGHVIEWQRCRR